jgi:hypothetical protein
VDWLAYWFWGLFNAFGCTKINDIYNFGMTISTVPNELNFFVILNPTSAAVVRHLFEVTALMVVAITDGCEALGTIFTLIRHLPSVNSQVNKEIPSLIKRLFTVRAFMVGRAKIANLSPQNVLTFTDLLGVLHMG